MSRIIIRGNFVFTPNKDTFEIHEDSYLVAKDGIIEGFVTKKPTMDFEDDYYDYGNRIIIPGLSDLHIHAPQYTYRGLGMDMELIEWLQTYTFPEESRYEDLEYARIAYQTFVKKIKRSATTHLNVFGTLHSKATHLLMKLIDNEGLVAYVGKVNMDRNGGANLQEESAKASLEDTEKWILATKDAYKNVKPMITPRFTPSCTDELMEGLGKLAKKYNVPVQSHLSENPSEVAWVSELCPWSECYADTYERWDMLGGEGNPKSVMAHCVYSADSKKEFELLKKNGTFIAHSPQSNTNIASGVAPIRLYLDNEMNVGLASDVAGGSSHCIFRAMVDAMQASKLRWRLQDSSLEPLSVQEAFFMGTKGGGKFFGNIGSFEPGYKLDAVVIDDREIIRPFKNPIQERIERIIYLANDGMIDHKFVEGKRIF